MGRFIINGGKRLSGEIVIDGSKNAVLPIIFSCILAKGVSVIDNLPEIADVDVALRILLDFGAVIERCPRQVRIDTRNLAYKVPNDELVLKIRASSYLIGACLSRFGRAKIQRFGGCNFDARPIDMHIYAAEALGAALSGDELIADKLHGGNIYFKNVSVGATVNAILLAVSADGRSRIYGYAREPHVISLIDFLKSGGADINVEPEYIEIFGRTVTDSHAEIIPDMIEAGTYIALSLMTDSRIKIFGADESQLDSFIEALKKSGAKIKSEGGYMIPEGNLAYYADIVTAPYPAFPTDLQPQTAALLAVASGGRITEGVWHNRFGYLDELSKFGVCSIRGDGYAEIIKSKINPANATSPDLRGGAALLMCALYADGESVIEKSEIIKRGYGNITEKLRRIGADIKEL